jgi:flavin reductase (DIM6/NTAB) family NADH-FMN oxidoreductase RutF
MDLGAKKTVLRQFTYGLYAVTATHNGDRGVFTANWLSQVSFEPPLVALSVEVDSSTLGLIRASGRFTICPLIEGQRNLAGALGRPRSKAGDKFETLNLATITTNQGDLALKDSLGYVTCEVRSESAAGDSVVFIAEVIDAGVFSEDDPLTMRDAGFRHAG